METYNWNIIKEKVENELFKLEVSHDSTMVQPEIEELVLEKLNILHTQRNNSSYIEYIQTTKKIIYCLDIYSKYIIRFKEYEDRIYKKYYNKINELEVIAQSEYMKLKEMFVHQQEKGK